MTFSRRSWAFDMIYWAKIDRRFFGSGDLKDRLGLLTPKERHELESFMQRKLAKKGEKFWEPNTEHYTFGAFLSCWKQGYRNRTGATLDGWSAKGRSLLVNILDGEV
jgi:hypothetical protein